MQKIVPLYPNAEKETTTFSFSRWTIEVQKGMTMSQMYFFLKVYLDEYLNPEDPLIEGFPFDPWSAEIELSREIIDKMTNIDMKSKNFSFKNLFASNLVDNIKKEIENYDRFQKLLDEYKDIAKQQVYSIKGLLDSFVDLNDFDMDKVKEISKAVKDVKKDIADNKVFEGLMEEGAKHNEEKNS